MDVVTVIAQRLARLGRALDSWLAPAHGATRQPGTDVRVWHIEQGRLYRQSLALQYVRTDPRAPRRR
jgi:hypothetical protein